MRHPALVLNLFERRTGGGNVFAPKKRKSTSEPLHFGRSHPWIGSGLRIAARVGRAWVPSCWEHSSGRILRAFAGCELAYFFSTTGYHQTRHELGEAKKKPVDIRGDKTRLTI